MSEQHADAISIDGFVRAVEADTKYAGTLALWDRQVEFSFSFAIPIEEIAEMSAEAYKKNIHKTLLLTLTRGGQEVTLGDPEEYMAMCFVVYGAVSSLLRTQREERQSPRVVKVGLVPQIGLTRVVLAVTVSQTVELTVECKPKTVALFERIFGTIAPK